MGLGKIKNDLHGGDRVSALKDYRRGTFELIGEFSHAGVLERNPRQAVLTTRYSLLEGRSLARISLNSTVLRALKTLE